MILISVDTLRADHLPAYGYRGVETPNLDALRDDAVLFENAYSHVPLTLPSHTTIFTGLLPPQNGVRDNLGYALGPGPATLAGVLKANGYATGGAVSTIVLSHATGIARGFDFYEDNIEPTEGEPVHLARAAERRRHAGAPGRMGRGALGRAVLRVPAPLRAALALRAARALPVAATSSATTARSRGPTRSWATSSSS